jgi:uncharacterized protein (DUF2252 family)
MLAPADPADRSETLERCRLRKMAKSAHAYVRGNTALFYEWLAVADLAKDVPNGPSLWICGDCHVGNLGPIADAEGKVDIQIRDLDQTVIGNPAHDLIRLALSLASAARGSDLPGVATAHIVEAMIDGYARALEDRRGPDEAFQPELVQSVRRRAIGRRWKHLARERIENTDPRIPLGRRFWSLTEDERAQLETLFEQPDMNALLLRLSKRQSSKRVRLLDAAYWVKGCSSLGQGRFAAVAEVEGATGRSLALIDFKAAGPSVAPTARGAKMPKDGGLRVVAGAKALSPNLGERMLSVRLLGQPYVARELKPQDLKIEISQFTRPEAVKAAFYLAHVVGRAHARQLDNHDRIEWARQLRGEAFGSLDAPPWLWRTVVKLMARHEAAYLEHCRRFALAETA